MVAACPHGYKYSLAEATLQSPCQLCTPEAMLRPVACPHDSPTDIMPVRSPASCIFKHSHGAHPPQSAPMGTDTAPAVQSPTCEGHGLGKARVQAVIRVGLIPGGVEVGHPAGQPCEVDIPAPSQWTAQGLAESGAGPSDRNAESGPVWWLSLPPTPLGRLLLQHIQGRSPMQRVYEDLRWHQPGRLQPFDALATAALCPAPTSLSPPGLTLGACRSHTG